MWAARINTVNIHLASGVNAFPSPQAASSAAFLPPLCGATHATYTRALTATVKQTPENLR